MSSETSPRTPADSRREIEELRTHLRDALEELIDHGERLDMVVNADLPALKKHLSQMEEGVRQVLAQFEAISARFQPLIQQLADLTSSIGELRTQSQAVEARLKEIESRQGQFDSVFLRMVDLQELLSVRLVSLESRNSKQLADECLSLADELEKSFVPLLRHTADQHRSIQTRYDDLMTLVTITNEAAARLRAAAAKHRPSETASRPGMRQGASTQDTEKRLAELRASIELFEHDDIAESPLSRALHDHIGHLSNILQDYAAHSDAEGQVIFEQLSKQLQEVISRIPLVHAVWQAISSA